MIPKIVILTIERRIHLAEVTKQSLIAEGVNENQIEIIIGYDKLDYPDMKRPYHLLTMAFIDKVLPFAIDNDTSIYYTECGVLFKCNPFNISIDNEIVNWLGYISKMKDYTIGSKLIYLPLSIITDMNNNPPRLAHMDRFIRQYALKNNKLVVSDKSHIFLQDYESDWGTEIQLKRKKALKKKYLSI